MTNLVGPLQQLRRHAGAAGAPTSLLSGQFFANDVDGVLYIGVGDNGSGISTSQRAVGTILDTYRYAKAINANATTSGAAAGGFDGLIAFVTATNSPGSNAARCLGAHIAAMGSGTTAGGDFETQLLAWLAAATTASPPGLGLSSTGSPTLAATIAALRTSALGQSF